MKPWKYDPLPLGSVKPIGWLHGEIDAMANGLAGHEYDFYIFVNESSWLNRPGTGGVEYSGLNEALPYWFNGLVPMAYILDNDRLKGQVHKVAETVLNWQAEDGWIGPEVGDDRNFWARAPLFLGLTQLAEANTSWESRIVDALQKFMVLANKMLKNNSQGFTNCPHTDCNWGQARIHDLIITIQWLLEKHPSSQDSLLWDNMDMFYSQLQFKWDQWYTEGKYPQIADPHDGSIFPYIHGVNVGQGKFPQICMHQTIPNIYTGLKASTVMYRFKGTDYFIQKSHNAVDWAFKYHGSASGTILADEEQRDLAHYMGSELCTAVETGYSLAYMYQVLGDNAYADRTERTMFNALPVMMTGDKWAHQYMAQPNQPFAVSTIQKDGSVPELFTTANSGVATTFGMEPQYPCCTVNHPQGYPKFVSNSWVRVGNSGLGHALLSPSTVSTTVNGAKVNIQCDTQYPFAMSFKYSIETDKDFDFYFRVPEWSKISTVAFVNAGSATAEASQDKTTGMRKFAIKAGRATLQIGLGTNLRLEDRPRKTTAVFYGNLLYALDVGYESTSTLPHAYGDPKGNGISGLPFKQLRDDYVNSTKEWNVAIDPSTIEYHRLTGDDAARMPNPVFADHAAPTYMTVQGCTIHWDLHLGITPDWAPDDRTCIGPKKTYHLIPYGSAKVHMTDLPVKQF